MTAPNPPDTALESELRESINTLRDQTRHADGKAQTLAGALIPSLVGAVAVGGLAKLPAAALVPAVPAVAFALAAIVALGAVIWPRTGEHPQPHEIEHTRSAARRREHSHLTRIASVKWRWLSWAITATAAALALGTATIVVATLA